MLRAVGNLVFIVFTYGFLALASIEVYAAFLVKQGNLKAGWQYLTVRDPEIGFTLRPNVELQFGFEKVAINSHGFRKPLDKDDSDSRLEGKYKILFIGDSVTFGNSIPFEKLFSEYVGSVLGKSRPDIKVINAAVPGYSNAQTELSLYRWLEIRPDLVVYADAFNSRGFSKNPNGPGGIGDLDGGIKASYDKRPWEVGNLIINSIYLYHHTLGKKSMPQIPLSDPLPRPRVSKAEYKAILKRIVKRSKDDGFKLVFLATGDNPAASEPATEGLGYFKKGNWAKAASSFEKTLKRNSNSYLPYYYLYQSYLQLGEQQKADMLLQQYKKLKAGKEYLTTYLHYADEYIEIMKSVADSNSIPFVDVREELKSGKAMFADICHFYIGGHQSVGKKLVDTIKGLLDNPASSG